MATWKEYMNRAMNETKLIKEDAKENVLKWKEQVKKIDKKIKELSYSGSNSAKDKILDLKKLKEKLLNKIKTQGSEYEKATQEKGSKEEKYQNLKKEFEKWKQSNGWDSGSGMFDTEDMSKLKNLEKKKEDYKKRLKQLE